MSLHSIFIPCRQSTPHLLERDRKKKPSYVKRLINGTDASLTVPAYEGITILVFTLSTVFYFKNVILSHLYKKAT